MKLTQNQLPKASSYRGAEMGRTSCFPIENLPFKYRMIKLSWVDGDYDKNGAYWGNSRNGENIYWAVSEKETPTKFITGYSTGKVEKSQIFVRALSRKEAKEKVRDLVTYAKFY